jgi:hypothetical protein
MNLETKLAVAGATTGIAVATGIKKTSSFVAKVSKNVAGIVASTGKCIADATVGTVKAVGTAISQNAREAKLKLR